MERKLKLVAMDLEGTLIPKSELESDKAKKIIRSNALEILSVKEPYPLIRVSPGMSGVFCALSSAHVPVGVASNCAYQYGLNLIVATGPYAYSFNPAMIQFAHQKAWEGMVLEGKSYDKVLEEWAKPSPRMLDEIMVEARKGGEIDPSQALYIGDSDSDRVASERANWKYMDISEVEKFSGQDSHEVYAEMVAHMSRQ